MGIRLPAESFEWAGVHELDASALTLGTTFRRRLERISAGRLAASDCRRPQGVLLSRPRYEEQMREFKDRTYPLLVQAGLR